MPLKRDLVALGLSLAVVVSMAVPFWGGVSGGGPTIPPQNARLVPLCLASEKPPEARAKAPPAAKEQQTVPDAKETSVPRTAEKANDVRPDQQVAPGPRAAPARTDQPIAAKSQVPAAAPEPVAATKEPLAKPPARPWVVDLKSNVQLVVDTSRLSAEDVCSTLAEAVIVLIDENLFFRLTFSGGSEKMLGLPRKRLTMVLGPDSRPDWLMERLKSASIRPEADVRALLNSTYEGQIYAGVLGAIQDDPKFSKTNYSVEAMFDVAEGHQVIFKVTKITPRPLEPQRAPAVTGARS